MEVVAAFLKLGCTSFGGPIAHLGYLREEFVVRRKWIEDAHFADLVALCQLLPGPASSQLVFALGKHRMGLRGAMLASLCFTLPSAVLMIAFAYGLALFGGARWLHGLEVAAVAIVAQAVWGMGAKLCTDRTRVSVCFAAAALVLAFPGAFVQVGAIAIGALVGYLGYRNTFALEPEAERSSTTSRGDRRWGAVALVACIALLVALPVIAAVTHSRDIAAIDAFYRSGALVFGGGHVVLPLLRAALVPSGFITDDRFLAGYAAAQALPGPLFAFAGYLGAAMTPGQAWIGGVIALLALFLPGWLLVGGALPFWDRLRTRPWARAALAGTNAAVVGVLLAALYNPVVLRGVRATPDAIGALLAFAALVHWRAPPWLVVGAMALAGYCGAFA